MVAVPLLREEEEEVLEEGFGDPDMGTRVDGGL